MTTAADSSQASMPRSVASRRSLLDHHIPSSDLGFMSPLDQPTAEGHAHAPITLGNPVTVSAPTSPTDFGPRPSHSLPTPLAIPVDEDPMAPGSSSRGPPRSALPDFAPPTASRQVMADSPSTIQAPQPYPQPQPGAGDGPDALAAVARPASPPRSPPRAQLSSYMAQHPDHAVKDAINKHFPLSNPIIRLLKRFRVKHSVIEGMTAEEMKHWEGQRDVLMRKAGWRMQGEEGQGVEVTDLFWKMYLSLMPTLERDPLSGLVPPDLIGSTGIMPLSVISLIPDIMAHYRDVIVRADKEVFLVTNYWQPSNSVSTIVKALRDLSANVVKEGRPKVIVKLMYDRGSWEQIWNSHAPVSPTKWASIDLPEQAEVPGIDLEVINFHRVLLGTFHAKFLVVDRKVALLNSNNIQDRPNLELMSHFEGPVVDSFYEIALQSWYNKLSPALPFIDTPYQPPRDSEGKIQYLFADRNPYFDDIEVVKAAKAARMLLKEQSKDTDLEKEKDAHLERQTFSEAVRRKIEQQRASFATWAPGEQLDMKAQQAMRDLREFRDKWHWNPSSRTGSRAPSRRTSMGDITKATDALREAQAEPTTQEQSEAPSSPTMVASELPSSRSKTLADPEKPHVAFVGVSDTDTGHAPLPTATDVQPGPHSLEGPSNPEKRHPPPTVLFTEAGGIREGPKPENIVEVPMTVASPNGDVPPPRQPEAVAAEQPQERDAKNDIGEDLPASARMPHEQQDNGKEMTGEAFKHKTLSVPKPAGIASAQAQDAEKTPRASGESEIRPEGTGTKRMFQLSKRFNAGALSDAWATVEDSDELDNFRPHVVHAPHNPVPIAMCCRKPHGFPGHHDIRNPQNAAWLAGFRYAKKKVFIQTPTLNARPIVRAIKQTCRRGVEVVLFLDLGFNDQGESIPFQGGTNEEVVDRLYKKLGKEKKEQYLKVYWYTGKDQVRPLNAVKKQRNCHIKFAAYDDQVLIIGNGNQDSQSWFHSQEVNVMIDSRQLVAEMTDTLLSNQNTMKYGLVGTDGVWRDDEGKTLQHYGATGSGRFRGLSALVRIIKSV